MTAPAARRLAGVHVLVTRATHQAADLIERLQAEGAIVTHHPMIQIAPIRDDTFEAALEALETFDWICFTSTNTVRVLFSDFHVDPHRLSSARIAAVGDVTAQQLRDVGLEVDFVPSEATGEALGRELVEHGISGSRVLIPGSKRSRRTLDRILSDAGADVVSVDCYTSVASTEPVDLEMPVDIATFYSPSAVSAAITVLGRSALRGTSVVCIGPTTEQSAIDHGLTVSAIADTADLDGMLAAVIQAAEERRTQEVHS